jgi:hypothetical protein
MKEHFKKHKTTYYCVVTGVVVAGFTVLITKGKMLNQPYVGHPDVKPTLRWTSAINFSGKNHTLRDITISDIGGHHLTRIKTE